MGSPSVREPAALTWRNSKDALIVHRFMMRGTLAGVHIFAWIFVFQYFLSFESSFAYAFTRVTLLYALSQIVICIATPFSARFLQYGVRRALLIATPIAAIALFSLGVALSLQDMLSVSCAVLLFSVFMGLYRALYWIPYEVESVALKVKDTQFANELLVAFAPLYAGLFILSLEAGPVWLLYGGTILTALSLIPLLFIQDMRETFSWGYRETFSHFFSIGNRRIAMSSFLDGISGSALLFFWPFLIYFIVGQSYGMLGVVLALTFLVSLFARSSIRTLLLRSKTPRISESRLLDVTLAISPWILRLAVATPLGIVLADAYFYTTARQKMGIDPIALEQVADGGSYLDEYTALKEVGLALGKIFTCILAVVAFAFVPVPAAFGLVLLSAAVASVAGVLLSR